MNDVYSNFWRATGFSLSHTHPKLCANWLCNCLQLFSRICTEHETSMQCVAVVQRMKNWRPAHLLIYLLTMKALIEFIKLSAWICCLSNFPSLYCVQEGNIRVHRNNNNKVKASIIDFHSCRFDVWFSHPKFYLSRTGIVFSTKCAKNLFSKIRGHWTIVRNVFHYQSYESQKATFLFCYNTLFIPLWH